MSLIFHYDKDLPKVTELKQEYLKNQVLRLHNIFQPEQKSEEWYEMRSNMLTASDWGTILGENHYSNSNEVLKKKCGQDNFMTNAAMQWGNKYEDVAVLVYEYRNNVKVLEFGCLRHPFIDFLGASPDGITKDGIMLEIKCPTSRKITGIPPSYYWCQVQGQLEVCELDRCDFLECSFKEYSSEEEYLMDNYENNYILNKFGAEKGLIAEFYKKETKTFKYYYSPVCLFGKEMEEWKIDIFNKYKTDDMLFSCFSYWYLEEVSCVPIYRNQEWFNTSKVELEIFWNKVLKYRELGLDQLLIDIQLEKEIKKEIKIENKRIKLEESGKKVLKKERKVKDKPVKTQKKMNDFIFIENSPKKTSESSESSESISEYNSEDDFNGTNTSMFMDTFNHNNGLNTSMFIDTFNPNEELNESMSINNLSNYNSNLSMFID